MFFCFHFKDNNIIKPLLLPSYSLCVQPFMSVQCSLDYYTQVPDCLTVNILSYRIHICRIKPIEEALLLKLIAMNVYVIVCLWFVSWDWLCFLKINWLLHATVKVSWTSNPWYSKHVTVVTGTNPVFFEQNHANSIEKK